MSEPSPPSPSTSVFTRQVLIVMGLLVLALFLWKILPVLVLMFAGVVMATVVHASSLPLSRYAHLPPTIAVATAFVLGLLLLGGGAYFFGHELAAQAEALWTAFTEAYAKLAQRLEQTSVGPSILETLKEADPSQAAGKVAKGALTVFGGITDVGLVIFLSIYFAIHPTLYRDGFLQLMPPRVRGRVRDALDASVVALRKWLLGQLSAMVTVGVLIGVSLAIVGVPLSFSLGLLSGVLEFVPVVGPIAGAIPGVLIAFADSPETALWAIGVYTVVLFLEGNVVMPIAQRWAVSLPPALGLLSIVAFGLVFGVTGVLFAIPLTVVLVVLVQKLYVDPMNGTESAPPVPRRRKSTPRAS